jgi:excisionase family DNA binding protein
MPNPFADLMAELRVVRALLEQLTADRQQAASAPSPNAAGSPWDVLAVAKHLGVSEKTIRSLISSGKMPSIRLGRRVLVADAIVTEFAERGMRTDCA